MDENKSKFHIKRSIMRSCYLLFLILFTAQCLKAQKVTGRNYPVGFTTKSVVDSSRTYKPDTKTGDPLHYRIVDLDLWYPAYEHPADSMLRVNDLLGLLETRANFYSGSNIGNGIALQLAQFFSETFKCGSPVELLHFKTSSRRNAAAAKGRFPLVIYMTAFNGMSYENFYLFEQLARKGIVVVSISSIGRFPGDMTMKSQDLMEQVRDAETAVKMLRMDSNIDFKNVGIVGYSWGGLAGVLLANKIEGLRCLVSLEGSEFHHYGNDKKGDEDFDEIKKNEAFKKMRLMLPYLRLESAPPANPVKKDSVYNFSGHHILHAQIFTIDFAKHEDFDCFSYIVPKAGGCPGNMRYLSALKLTAAFLEEHLQNKGKFAKAVNEALGRTIKDKGFNKD
ncbi:dienelactone hydrolase family protein [Niabella sp. CC-SYL272]|uniref:dienelactone hydrolase family protein n=1 Tax=Niabella agricola TaxID=2891571 RepID=UPI001F43D516|nr:dienelactone hydrolase family protein [Niabella agricola]MCF3108959.1 dienelactone hydrolase family protein [Niabella agricola]